MWRCDTTFFKGDLASKLAIAPDDLGAFHLHSNEKKEPEAYAREMCAEEFEADKKAWVNPARKPNHAWDCEVMALDHILNVRSYAPTQKPRSRRRHGADRKREALQTGWATSGGNFLQLWGNDGRKGRKLNW